jgi:hypothetical protein
MAFTCCRIENLEVQTVVDSARSPEIDQLLWWGSAFEAGKW